MKKPQKFSASKGLGGSGRLHILIAVPLSLISGCLVFLSFPDFDLFVLQWFSLIPLLFALNGRGFWGCFFLGLSSGAATNCGGFYWIKGLLMDFGHMGEEPALALTVLLSLYQGLIFAVSSGIYGAFRIRHPKTPPFLLFPVLFTAVEFLTPFIFPWYFGNGQYRFLAVSQIAELTGPAGVTFLVVLVNAAFYEVADGFIALRKIRLFPLIASVALFTAAVVYGVKRIGEIDAMVASGEKMKIGLVEADVGIWEKEARDETGAPLPPAEMIRMLYGNLLKHQKLSQSLENEGVDLIVWPESSYIPVSNIMIKRTSHFVAVLTEDALFLDDGGKFVISKEFKMNPGMKAVSAASEDFIVAAGKGGTVYIFANGEWKRELTGHDRDFHAVKAFDTDEVSAVAAGEAGIVMFRTPKGWIQKESGTNRHLNAVICSSPARCLFGGESGVITLYDGSGFKPVRNGFTETILSGALTAEGKFVLTGERGLFLVYDGEKIERIETGTNADLYAAVAYGDSIIAAGDGGTLLKYSDGKIQRVDGKIKADIRSAAVISDGRIVLGGSNGAVYVKVAGGEGFVREQIAAHKEILSISDMGYTKDFPVPKDARYIYKSFAPLPEKVDDDGKLARRERNAALRGFSTPLLMGVVTYEESEGGKRYFNTAMLVDQNGKVLGMYDKNYLLIFGEYIPFGDKFPKLYELLPEAGNFRPGKEVNVFEFGKARIGVMICYEDIIPRLTRKLAGKQPNLLINITNDAWFGKTSEPYQHLALSTMRAIENRLFLVRSTNTGISAFIDPAGRIVSKTSLYEPETLTGEVALMSVETVYRRYGDLFAYAAIFVSMIFSLLAFRKK